jgi:EpsD family peptidyl-prolyl cis-trans isomerase
VLDQLIDEQIVAQKAVTAKLDKDPKVVAQLEAARRDILARRFVEAAADTVAKPPEDQVQKFYDGHPGMFAQRKIYTLQRLDVQAPDERRTEIDAHVTSLKTLSDLTDWLKSQHLPYTVKQEQDAAEQLTPAILDKLVVMKDGESMVIPSQSGVSAVTLMSSVTAPKTLADARGPIEQFLSNQGKRDVVMNLQKTLREGVKIDYLGKYASATAASAPTSNTPASK